MFFFGRKTPDKSTMAAISFFFNAFLFHLIRKRSRELPSAGFLWKYSQNWGWARQKPGGWDSVLGSHMEDRDRNPSAWGTSSAVELKQLCQVSKTECVFWASPEQPCKIPPLLPVLLLVGISVSELIGNSICWFKARCKLDTCVLIHIFNQVCLLKWVKLYFMWCGKI